MNNDKKDKNALYEQGHEFIHSIRTELFCIEISNKSLSLYLPQLIELYEKAHSEGLNTFDIPGSHLEVIKSSSSDIKSQLDSVTSKTSLFLDSLNHQPSAQSQSRLSPQDENIQSNQALQALLVEDEEIHRDIARHVLAPSKCDFTLVENGIEALDKLSQASYDLILIDLHMPKMSGMETLAAIKSLGKKYKDTPCIGISNIEPVDTQAFYDAGFDHFILKPLRLESFTEVLTKLYPNRES